MTFDFYKEAEKIRSKFWGKHKITNKEHKKNPNAIIGNVIPCGPEHPTDAKKAFELFKEYYAQIQFVFFRSEYEELTPDGRKKLIKDIESFRQKALESCTYEDAAKHRFIANEQEEYVILSCGYYNDHCMINELNESSLAARIYGKYFLFYEYLKGLIKDEDKSNLKKEKGLRFIALKCSHTGKALPPDASRKLQDHYGYYQSKTNRTGNGETPVKLKNKIALFEAVAKELKGQVKGRANDEIKILKGYL